MRSLILVALLLLPRPAPAAEVKIATLVPRGSAWARLLEKGGRESARRTEGRVKTRYYFGGVMGDERDMVRKMKLGQIDGAVLSAVGLGLICPDVLVLQLPFLLRSEAELDYLRDRMWPEFQRRFADAGYVLLSWGDLGWIHLMTTWRPASADEMRKLKYWLWADSPIMRVMLERLKVNTIALGAPEIVTALQVGTVDAVYNSLIGAIALQWYTRVKYIYEPPMAYGIGGLVVRRAEFEKLSPADQEAIRAASLEVNRELTVLVRRDNARARKTLERAGLKFVAPPAAWAAEVARHTGPTWLDMAGKVYPREMLDRVVAYLEEFREQKH